MEVLHNNGLDTQSKESAIDNFIFNMLSQKSHDRRKPESYDEYSQTPDSFSGINSELKLAKITREALSLIKVLYKDLGAISNMVKGYKEIMVSELKLYINQKNYLTDMFVSVEEETTKVYEVL